MFVFCTGNSIGSKVGGAPLTLRTFSPASALSAANLVQANELQRSEGKNKVTQSVRAAFSVWHRRWEKAENN